MPIDTAPIGVAIAAFNSAGFIADCLDSLQASENAALRVVVVDNDSADETLEIIREWAERNLTQGEFVEARPGQLPQATGWLTVLKSPVNGGFAHATNRGLALLEADRAIGLFWVLNPDCRVLPDTAAHYARAGADGAFALMGGRTIFADMPGVVQTDGGRVSRWSGRCHSVNQGAQVDEVMPPDPSTLDYITGANCVVSRAFLEQAGLMREDYFLYYEEVDWAMRRGALPLRIVPEAIVEHVGGASIGSGVVGRRPSPFANYFNYRNRLRFLRRFAPMAVPCSYLVGLAKAAQLFAIGAWDEARAIIAGMFGGAPPEDVRQRLAPSAQAIAFGK